MAFDKITHFIIGLSFICIILTLVAVNAQAEDLKHDYAEATTVSMSSDHKVHSLIKEQLAAIKARDADKAWSYTSDHYHRKFDTAKDFLSHLRFSLRPVYNNETYKLLGEQNTDNGLIQRVEVQDEYGEPATVIYRLEKQDDGKMLIDSFAILDLDAEPI